MTQLAVPVEAALRILEHQEKALGNVAAGILVRSYRLYGEWNEAQVYQANRIISEVEAAKKRAARIMEEADKVGRATAVLTAEQEKLERLRVMQAKMRLRKSPK